MAKSIDLFDQDLSFPDFFEDILHSFSFLHMSTVSAPIFFAVADIPIKASYLYNMLYYTN